jgi:DNA-binding transcriptional ArsR family regulator
MAIHPNNLDQAFQALSDPTRRAIVARLCLGPASVSELSAPFRMAMPTLLRHIGVLETSGLIGTRKIGRVRRCTIEPAALEQTQAWFEEQRAVWESRLDRLDAYVQNLHKQETEHARQKPKK